MNFTITNFSNYGTIYFQSQQPFTQQESHNQTNETMNNLNEMKEEKEEIIESNQSESIEINETIQTKDINENDNQNKQQINQQIEQKENNQIQKGIDMSQIQTEIHFKNIPTLEKTFYQTHYSYLNEWTSKTHFTLIYNSEEDGLTAKSFNTILKNKSNILLVIFTKKGYVLGSYHSTIPEYGTMINNDSNHFIFSLSSPYLSIPTQFKGKGILHIHDDFEDHNVFDIFSGFSVYSNHTIMVYSSFASAYNTDNKNLIGKANSKVSISKVVAFECN